MCVREREREGGRDGRRERERKVGGFEANIFLLVSMSLSVCWYCCLLLFIVNFVEKRERE